VYDASGNLVDDGTNTYTYNARNQMTSFSDGVNLTTYGYDASGYRVTKTWSGGTAYFVMGAGEYYNGSWVRIHVKIGGKKLAEYSDNTTYFYAHNHLGGPSVITDHTGAVAARYRYYPFCEEWITEGTKSDRHRFTGAERDGESGLTYHGARHYSASSGRWTTPDPVAWDTSNPQRLNRYGYVLNDPVNFLDPVGLNEEPYNWGDWFTVVTTLSVRVVFLGGAGFSGPPSHFLWREAMRANTSRAIGNAGGLGGPNNKRNRFRKLLPKVVNYAKKLIQNCEDFFHEQGLSTLEYYYGEHKIRGYELDNKLIGGAIVGPFIGINPNGPFLNPRESEVTRIWKKQYGVVGMTDHLARQIILLHELAHVVYNKLPEEIRDEVFPSDAHNVQDNFNNTKKIIGNCVPGYSHLLDQSDD